MGLLFDGLGKVSDCLAKTVEAPVELPKVKYEPIRLTEDEALKRTPESDGRLSRMVTSVGEKTNHGFNACMNPPKMSEPERQKLIQVVQNFNDEELEIVLDTVPLEMCFDRIRKEIDRAKEFESVLKSIVGKMK